MFLFSIALFNPLNSDYINYLIYHCITFSLDNRLFQFFSHITEAY